MLSKKQLAHSRVRKAVVKGALMRPDICGRCGAGGKIIGHHEDYDQELVVMWLCGPCHSKRHKELGWGVPSPKRGSTAIRLKTGRTARIALSINPETKVKLERIAQFEGMPASAVVERLVEKKWSTLRKWGRLSTEEEIASNV